MNLLTEMPKLPNPALSGTIFFKFLKSRERSDTTILGNLGILEHFRHFPACPPLADLSGLGLF
jgi:hypothetical protein